MKFNSVVLAIAMAIGSSSIVHAADQGRGKVTFTGSIVDAPCSISAESVDQTIEMGQVSNVSLKNGGKSTPRQFSIKLEQCDTSTLKNVTTTFNGASSPDNKDLLGIVGTASGASIALSDMASQPIKLGVATNPQSLADGSNTLRYVAHLQGDSGEAAKIVPGEFKAVADFTLTYQ
ncbi:TPA: fimbrial protein [Serratia marcescens]